jgi:hypothetical protein
MKHLLTLTICIVVFFSCRKNDIAADRNDYLSNVQNAMKDSLSTSDFESLDFSKAVQSKVDTLNLSFLRIPFKNKQPQNDFVIVRTDLNGKVNGGKIVHLEGKAIEKQHGYFKAIAWDGSIKISSLNRGSELNSSIVNGFITELHQSANTRSTLVQPSNVLPEVVIVYVRSSGSNFSWSSWVSLQSMFFDYGWNGSYGLYGSYDQNLDGSDGYSGGGGGSGGGSNGGPQQDPPIQIDYETQDALDPIDLQKFINCFNAIPDNGATCSIEIFTDMPVDNDPNKIFDFNSGSPGHVYIQLKKSNGSQNVTQNIGFYPKTGWKTMLTNAPIDGKFVDNGMHEFNASFKMNLSPQNFNSTLTEMLYLRNMKYDIDNFNCTDWALNVFNKTRTDKLEIPLIDIPGNVPSSGSRTPQGLYLKLREMKNANHPEAANIDMMFMKGWTAYSDGPCN